MLIEQSTFQYDVPDLKLLACKNFERECNNLYHSVYSGAAASTISAAKTKVWFAIVEYVYENSNPTEPGLRASVVKIWTALSMGMKLGFERKKWLALIKKFPEVGVDIVMDVAPERRFELGTDQLDNHELYYEPAFGCARVSLTAGQL